MTDAPLDPDQVRGTASLTSHQFTAIRFIIPETAKPRR